MNRLTVALAALFLSAAVARAAAVDDVYKAGPDSDQQPGVPAGKTVGPTTLPSQIYPGSLRNYWVYVPAQYDPGTPASLMIFFDGHYYVDRKNPEGFRIPNVFDNLIFRREMPVTIGVFVNPGRRPDQPEATDAEWGDRTINRRVEYNALDDTYAKLVVDELLPQITSKYNISKNPEDRGLCGASSGAICAFTVAWHRPDQFRKVISTIGSFTNIMGGDAYPDLIRKTDAKPLRVFLQDGVNDNRGLRPNAAYDPRRDWHWQNSRMVDALKARNYDFAYVFGIGSHAHNQGVAVMPEMLRWLWRDYPRTAAPEDAAARALFVQPPPRHPASGPAVKRVQGSARARLSNRRRVDRRVDHRVDRRVDRLVDRRVDHSPTHGGNPSAGPDHTSVSPRYAFDRVRRCWPALYCSSRNCSSVRRSATSAAVRTAGSASVVASSRSRVGAASWSATRPAL